MLSCLVVGTTRVLSFFVTELMCCPKPGKLAEINTFPKNCEPGSAIPLVCQAKPKAALQQLVKRHKNLLKSLTDSLNLPIELETDITALGSF